MTGYFLQNIYNHQHENQRTGICSLKKEEKMRTFGIERERFIINVQKKVVSAIDDLLPRVHQIAREQGISSNLFTYELFAGQIEDRTPPCSDFKKLQKALLINDGILLEAANGLELSYDNSEFIEKNRVVAFEVNSFDKRHQEIWTSISNDKKIAASIVAAIHVHISVFDETEVVRVLNICRKKIINELIRIGDHSNLKRIKNYQTMAGTNCIPPKFVNFLEVMEYIASKGGEKNVWDLVRYKASTKTIEFRMFGATPNIKEIIGYVRACQNVFKI